MKRHYFIIALLLTIALNAFTQQILPADQLTKEFHASRREAFRKLMPKNSVAVVFAYPTRTFSQDVSYPYHQNPDLYYFSGYNEPNAVLFIFKEPQTTTDNKDYNELFFIQKRDPARETWTGKRMGVDRVKSELGFDMVFTGSAFKNFPINFSKFDKILFEKLPEDVSPDISDTADLYNLIKIFRQKAVIPVNSDPATELLIYKFGRSATMKNFNTYKEGFQRGIDRGILTKDFPLGDQLTVGDILNIQNADGLKAAKEKLRSGKTKNILYDIDINLLRQIKTPEEINLMKKAIEISCMAHIETMKAIQPGMSELELQGIQEYIHKKYGAEEVGYPSIVGAGENGCTLHYEENNKKDIGNDMVLMDVGAEYHGYTADITRTIPSTGKFNTEQKLIYDLVYKAQEEVLKLCREGISFDSTESRARQVVADGLIDLGIIKTRQEANKYYPHGCSHFLGLDVHDKGNYTSLLANMVITVEPGIYIPADSPCDKKWWGIAVRIEDDVLIKKDGYELLSYLAPRKSSDVEKMVAEKSALNDLVLPELPGVH